ncbi:MAG TPA: tetratricopeptide repeat protein [Gemmataceae bacterium]|jgi:tetratricopeptide (TPR) repeat protein|nr:tetratricopeptide repeat protein [Gemmataceae bacterium]
MPILNRKLLLRLVVGILFLGSGLVVLHHVQAGRVPEALLWQADAAIEKGRPDKAIQYLRQYLEFRPDDLDTTVRLADLILERAASGKDIQNAHFLYERVLRESPQRDEVARKLVTLCIHMRRHADALEHAQKLLATHKDDGVLHAQIAQCLVAQNRQDEARAEFDLALTLAPNYVPAYEEYADLLDRHFKKPAESGAVLEKLTKANPHRPEAFLAYARYLGRSDKPDVCLQALDRVFALDPENRDALILSAEMLQAKGDMRKARECLRNAIAQYPRYAHAYRALSWLETMSGNQADAVAALEGGIAVLPDAPELLTPLADFYIERGDLDAGRAIVTKLDELQKTVAAEYRRLYSLRASYLRGRLLIKEGKWNEALVELDALRTEALGMTELAAQLNLLLAACHERKGDCDAQVEALRRVLAADPNHLAARVALANAHLNSGRFEDALKEYQTASKSPVAGIGVQLTYASLRISWARSSEAPDEEWKAIGVFLTKLGDAHRDSVEPIILRAEWLAARGDFAGAEKLLESETVSRPGDVRLWSALAGMAGRARGTLAVAVVLGRGQLAAGDSIELRLARARAWADDIQPRRERRLASLEALPPTAGDADRARLMSGLADVYAAIRVDAGRKRVLGQLASMNAQDIEVRKELFARALRGDDSSVRKRWQNELQRAEGPTGKSVVILEALQELGGGTIPSDRKLADWRDLAQSALEVKPDHAEAHLLLGTVAERRHDAATAAKQFDLAVDFDPTVLKTQEARLAHYLRTGHDEAARRTLARLEADPRLSAQRFRTIVEDAILQGGADALPKCLTWLAAHLKREPRSAVWAGGLLEANNKLTDAIALYKQATETLPTFADGWSARLLASAKLGQAEVNETIALAAKALDRPSLFSICAECGAMVRAKFSNWSPPVTTAEDRRAYAQACVAACEARGRLEDAVPILTMIADAKDSPSADAAWAKQTLATLTAAFGTPERQQEAIQILKAAGIPSASIDEVRSRAAALTIALRTVSGDDRRAIVRELIELLTAVTRDPVATANDWLQLAQLQRTNGDRAAVRRSLQVLTKREPDNLFYLALNVDELLSDNKLEEARPFIARLAPGVADVRVLATVARFHTLANEPDAALKVMDGYVRLADAGTADGATRQRQAADLLDQLTRLAASKGLSCARPLLDAACERYRASLRNFPDSIAPMTALMASAGQVQPALGELEKHKARVSAATLATAGVGILRTGQATTKQFETVKVWIDVAMMAAPDSIPLKLCLGEFFALCSDFANAEPIYRDVLKAEPKNVHALNNLAWILATRPDFADEALRYVDSAIAQVGVTAELLDTRARVLISAGRYDRAIADLTDAIGQGAGPLRYFHLALAHSKMGKSIEATTAFRNAVARGLDVRMVHPDDAAVFRLLASQAQ